jgi:predicted  nucleic acid-binding Zn-ribbon protein
MELKSAQCARCETIHEMSSEILKSGCPVCGSRVLRFGGLKEKTDDTLDAQWISEDSPTNIKVVGEGKYEIDLEALMNQEKTSPIVISQNEGKYKLSFPKAKESKKSKR